MKEIFLAGSFREESDEEKIRSVYDLLRNTGEYEVWWAREEIYRHVGHHDESLIPGINRTQEKKIENSDIFVAVMRRATFGVAGEIKHAYDLETPIIGYIYTFSEDGSYSKDFESGWFKHRVKRIVKNDEELLKELENVRLSLDAQG